MKKVAILFASVALFGLSSCNKCHECHYDMNGASIEDYPTSFKNYTCEISLPVYYNLSNEQVKEVANAVEDAVESIL